MKHILILILAFSTVGFFAQELSSKKFNRFQLGVSFSPDVCYRTLKETDITTTQTNIFLIDARNEMETPKFGYTAGVNFSYSLNQHFRIESGLHFSNKGYGMKKQDLYSNQQEPGIPTNFKFIENFYYLDIPLKVNFALGKNKWRFISSVGASANFFLKETQTQVLYFSDKTDRSTSSDGYSYNKLNISTMVSLGIDYRLSDKMSLRIEPTFRYGVLKIIDAPVTAYLYSAGMNVGYFIGF